MPPKRACRLALLAAAAAYLLFLLLFELPSVSLSPASTAATHRPRRRELEASSLPSSPLRPHKRTFRSPPRRSPLAFSSIRFHRPNSSSIDASASSAFAAAAPLLSHILSAPASPSSSPSPSPSATASCPATISVPRDRLTSSSNGRGVTVELPCGMGVGSHVTVVARPRAARPERDPRVAEGREGVEPVMVSQFMVELLGTKAVQGEEPPRILHFNPRILHRI